MAHKFPYIFDDNHEIVAVPLNVRDQKFYDPDVMYQCWTIKSKIRNRRELAKLLHEALDEHCHHSYDCCGRWYRSVHTSTLRRIKRNEWQVEVGYHCNV